MSVWVGEDCVCLRVCLPIAVWRRAGRAGRLASFVFFSRRPKNRPNHHVFLNPITTPHRLTLDEKYDLCRSVAQECIQDAELRNLLAHKPDPVAYDGFEPSGRMHIAQGVMKALNVNKLTRAGVTFKFW